MNEDTLDIALGLHNANGYHIHALTAICSVMANTTHPVKVHLMHDDSLGGEEKAQFSALADRFSGAVVFHEMTGKVGVFPEIPALRNFSKGTLFRLFIPELVPGRRVLYLDSDTVCTLDIASVFRLGRGRMLCAVQDKAWIREKFRNYVYRALGEVNCYFNAGVLLFDCKEMNRNFSDVVGTMRDCLISRPNLLFPDQDVLNMTFGRYVGYLPQFANHQLKFEHQLRSTEEGLSGKIVHFSGPKPWKEAFPAGMLYWRHRKMLGQLLAG